MAVLNYKQIGTYSYEEEPGAEIKECKQYQIGIESKALIDLYLDAEKFAKERGKNIIYIDLCDARPDKTEYPGFSNVQDKDIVIALHPNKATKWVLAHELVHVLENYKFYCRISVEKDVSLKEKYEKMFNLVLDIPINRIVKKRGLDVNEEIKWRIERAIIPRLENEIEYDSWDRFTIYIANFFDFDLFVSDRNLEWYFKNTYYRLWREYSEKFKYDVYFAKHISAIILRVGFTNMEKFDKCLIAIFQDERFREKYDIPEIEIEPDFPDEYKRNLKGI